MAPHILTILTGRNLPKIWEWNCGFYPGSRPGWWPTFLPHIRELTRV
jgi:hypothetical protein